MFLFRATHFRKIAAWGLAMVFLLAACNTAPTILATVAPLEIAAVLPTETPVSSPSAHVPTATRTKSPMLTPIPLMLTATPSPTPKVEWGELWGTPAVLQGTDGAWSPTANEFLFFDCDLINLEKTALVLASGPEFITTTLTTQTTCQDFIWSLDGQYILYSDLPTGDAPATDYSNVAQINRDGRNPHKLGPGNLWWLNFGGWMDEQRIVYSSYQGGGHIFAAIKNIATGDFEAGSILHGGTYPAHGDYLPAVDDFAGINNQHLLVISKHFPGQVFGRAEGNFVLMPEFAGQPITQTVSLFEDWRGDTNQILAFWGYFDFPDWKPVGTNLLLWDVDTGALRLLAPNGVAGKFSSDGTWLAYLTNGPANLDEDGRPVETAQDFSPTAQSFLQLMAMDDEKVKLSLPALSQVDDY